MRRAPFFAILAVVSLGLAACAPATSPATGGDPPTHVANAACPGNAVSNGTALDEKLALGVEGLYASARTAVELGVDSGVVKGATATRLRVANRKAYDGVKEVRAAYCAGNQASYMSAAVRATEAISAYLAASRGGE